MSHPNDMSVWSDIVCQRGHDTHKTRSVSVDLASAHGYRDQPPIPRRLARSFDMFIWDTDRYPVDGGPYCPAHDAVSETIVSHRIWEPAETIMTLLVCETPGMVLDFGAQIGWFTLLAASCGRSVVAWEADPDCARLVKRNADLNNWAGLVTVLNHRISLDSEVINVPGHVRFAKVDVEGAEDQVTRILWPAIQAGQVDHMLIEVSPVFAGYYPELVADIIQAGYCAYLMPAKSRPPFRLRAGEDLEPLRIDTLGVGPLGELVSSLHQANVWFRHRDAKW
jgi:Met-10+ like-protein